MPNSINKLTEAIFWLEKSTIHLGQEAQRIVYNILKIKSKLSVDSDLVSRVEEIENGVQTILDLAEWIEDVQSQLEKLRTDAIQASFH